MHSVICSLQSAVCSLQMSDTEFCITCCSQCNVTDISKLLASSFAVFNTSLTKKDLQIQAN